MKTLDLIMKIKTTEMLRQTVVILIGKYQLKEEILCVVFQQVSFTNNNFNHFRGYRS